MTERDLLKEITKTKLQYEKLTVKSNHWLARQIFTGKEINRLKVQANGLSRYLKTLNQYIDRHL